jgi:hypothetical protein
MDELDPIVLESERLNSERRALQIAADARRITETITGSVADQMYRLVPARVREEVEALLARLPPP